MCVCVYIYIYIYTHINCCCLVTKSCKTLETPWTIACQVPLSVGILQKRVLEWVAMTSSRRSSQHRDLTLVSCITG